jgi:hypothetical protein
MTVFLQELCQRNFKKVGAAHPTNYLEADKVVDSTGAFEVFLS